jgi:hypothetical protein
VFTSWLSFGTGGNAIFGNNINTNAIGNAFGAAAFDAVATINIRPNVSSRPALAIRGLASQSVDLFYVQDSAAVLLAAIGPTGDFTFTPSASRTLATNGHFTFERVSNTEINLVYRGDDGVTRRSLLTFV